MNAVRFPDAQTARLSAMLSADGRSKASSRSRSESTSPTRTGRFDPPSATAWWYSVTSASVITRDGPFAPGDSGRSLSTTSAVIAFATDPIGRTTSAAWLATSPGMLELRAKLPADGTGIGVAGPVAVSTAEAGTSIRTAATGSRAVTFTTKKDAAAISITATTAIQTIHGHRARRAGVIGLILACLPVACVRGYPGRRRMRGERQIIRPDGSGFG